MSKPTKVPALGPSTKAAVACPLLHQARIADVRQYERILDDDGEPNAEAVHDMRVAARRLRAVLALFGNSRMQALEPQVKALQDALGAIRDVQVHRDWLLSRQSDVPAAPDLARRIDQERPGADKKLRAALKAWTGAIAPALERALSTARPPGRLGGKRVGQAVCRAASRLERRVPEVDDELEPRAAHALRIAAKKLRYVAELARPGYPKRARRLLDVLEPFLDQLGELHDTDVRMARIDRLAADDLPPGERTAALAILRKLAAQRAEQAAALLAEIERWRAEDFLGAARRAFGRSGSGRALRQLSAARAEGASALAEGAPAAG